MGVALAFWAASIIACIVISVYLCHRIEQSRVQRWGATGKLFSYEEQAK